MTLASATSIKTSILVVLIMMISGCASTEETRKFHLDKVEAEIEALRQMPKEELAKYIREMLTIMIGDDPSLSEVAHMTPEGRTKMIDLAISMMCNSESYGKSIRARYATQLTHLAPEDRIRISEKTFSLFCQTMKP
jgi:hypothetical protein